MSEREQSPEILSRLPRDQVLHEMAIQGWGTGSPEPYEGGLVYLVEIERRELLEVVQAFHEEMAAARFVEPTDLIGRWSVEVTEDGYEVTELGRFDRDSCETCGAHISDPHAPDCLNIEPEEFGWDDAAEWRGEES